MPPSNYSRGRQTEYRVVERLRKAGYATIRAASSKGNFDVIATSAERILLVSCKRATTLTKARSTYKAERDRLLGVPVPPGPCTKILAIWADTTPDAPRGAWAYWEEIA